MRKEAYFKKREDKCLICFEEKEVEYPFIVKYDKKFYYDPIKAVPFLHSDNPRLILDEILALFNKKNEPKIIYDYFNGLSEDKLINLAEAISFIDDNLKTQYKDLLNKIKRILMIALSDDLSLILSNLGLNDKIIDDLKNNEFNMRKVNNNYYFLYDYYRFNFKLLDELSYLRKASEFDYERIKRIIIMEYKKYCFNNGHSFLNYYFFVNRIKKYNLDFKKEELLADLSPTLLKLIDEGIFFTQNNNLFLTEYYKMEDTIKEKIEFYTKSYQDKWDIENKLNSLKDKFNHSFSNDQIQAIKNFFNNRLSLISGIAGSGKTSVIKAIVKIIKEEKPKAKLIALAPTGKAVSRIKDLCECEAKTIHSFVNYNLDLIKNKQDYDRNNYEYIIIDEASMVDMELFYLFLNYINDIKNLVLIGDLNQLPPIGIGYIFKDLYQYELPKVKLNYNFRTKNSLGDFINAVLNRNINLEQNSDNSLIFKALNKTEINAFINEYCKQNNDFKDRVIINAVNKGETGVYSINLLVQKVINNDNDFIRIKNNVFYLNDKVMHLRNDQINNGEIGYINNLDNNDNQNPKFNVKYRDLEMVYDIQNIDDLSLAYALSVHKAQGSEFDEVIFIIDKDYPYMYNFNLIYTAVSRAKTKLFILGDLNLLRQSIKKEAKPRDNRLSILLKK